MTATATATRLLPAPTSRALEDRLVDATLACVGRWGVAKTGLDDVAREAGCSRATVYRAFPGGKDALIEAWARTELVRFCTAVADRMAAAGCVEDLLVAGIHEAGTRIARHAALRYLVTYEPEVVLPRLAFRECDAVLAAAVDFAAPHLERFLDAVGAARAAEWATRVLISYSCLPADDVDLTDEVSVRRLVQTFVLPAFVPGP